MRLTRFILALVLALLATVSEFEIVRLVCVTVGSALFLHFLTGPRYARKRKTSR